MKVAPPPLFVVLDAARGGEAAVGAGMRVAARLSAVDRPHQLFVAREPGELGAAAGRAVHAAHAARGAVVAAGDDRMLNAVAQAVWNAGLPLGLLPLGASSDVGAAHGIPLELDTTLDALLQAHARPVTVGLLGERIFLGPVHVGPHPPPVNTRDRAPERLERASWVDVFGPLRAGAAVMTLELRGHDHTRTRVLRACAMWVGTERRLPDASAPRIESETGPARLTAVVAQPLPLARSLWLALRGSLGSPRGAQLATDRFAFDRLLVRMPRRARRLQVTLDGEELALDAPLVFQAAPRPLRLLVRGD